MTRDRAEVYREALERLRERSPRWEERPGSACRVWRGEGAWLRRLHALPLPDEDPAPLSLPCMGC